jgi:hypothetical protein
MPLAIRQGHSYFFKKASRVWLMVAGGADG